LFTTVQQYLLISRVKKKNVLNDVNARVDTFSTKENVSKKNFVQWTEDTVTLEIGPNARLNVTEEPEPEPDNVTTLLLLTGVQNVKEKNLKWKFATPTTV